jgi:hypothetical protein
MDLEDMRSQPAPVGMIAFLERHRQQRGDPASDYVRYIPFVVRRPREPLIVFFLVAGILAVKSLYPYLRAYLRAAFIPIFLNIQATSISGNRRFGSIATRRRTHH